MMPPESDPMSEFSALPYRPCVGVMMVNTNGHVFVGRRIDTRGQPAEGGDFWQMPQGGVDPGEELEAAAYRELAEETGVAADLVSMIARTREELFYDLPDELLGKLWGGKWRGQRQHWYLARFAGSDTDVRLDAHDPAEFDDWRWVQPDLLPELIVPFKARVYRSVLDEFRDLI